MGLSRGRHFFSQYKLGKKLGEGLSEAENISNGCGGAFGQVRMVVERATQQELAVKIVDVRERDEHGVCSSLRPRLKPFTAIAVAHLRQWSGQQEPGPRDSRRSGLVEQGGHG